MAEKTELTRVLSRLAVLESCLDTIRDLLGEAKIHTDALRQLVNDIIDREEFHARKD